MTSQSPITIERLKEVLSYDPETGVFTSLIGRRGKRSGQKLGSPTTKGYTSLMIDRKRYFGHILAWFYMTWEWPGQRIDHKNCTPGDDRFDNLREATSSQNAFNRRIHCNNTSGYKGVSLKEDRIRQKPWRTQIFANGKRVWSAYFSTAEEAAAARAERLKEFHGEFSRQ